MKNIFLVLIFTAIFVQYGYAAENWSPVLNVKLIFPQAKREDPNHPHSEKILVALSDMAWLPPACTNRGYFYIEKTDTQVYSLILAAMAGKSTIQVSVTDQQIAAGICRATMVGSPTWN